MLDPDEERPLGHAMSSIAELETFEHESARFDSLMSFKIQNILLVSSLYDIYNLRED